MDNDSSNGPTCVGPGGSHGLLGAKLKWDHRIFMANITGLLGELADYVGDSKDTIPGGVGIIISSINNAAKFGFRYVVPLVPELGYALQQLYMWAATDVLVSEAILSTLAIVGPMLIVAGAPFVYMLGLERIYYQGGL